MKSFLSWLTKPKGLILVFGTPCVLLSSYMVHRPMYNYQVYKVTKYGIYVKVPEIMESSIKL